MKKTVSIVATAILAVGIGYMLFRTPNSQPAQSGTLESAAQPTANVSVKDGIQYVTLNAKGGYSPEISIAQGGMPTKLIMKTNGTFDCSSSLVVPVAGYRGMLPTTGETTVDLSSPKSGETVQGACGMGMYRFAIRFK